MDRSEAITQLPVSYQRALHLVAVGRTEDEIAGSLGIERAAVRALVGLAEAKLARLTCTSPADDTDGGGKER